MSLFLLQKISYEYITLDMNLVTFPKIKYKAESKNGYTPPILSTFKHGFVPVKY